MADEPENQEKTEEASAKRRREAREKGQVALSNELLSAVMLLAGLGTLLLAGGSMMQILGRTVVRSTESLPRLGPAELDLVGLTAAIGGAGDALIEVLAIVAAPLLVIGLVVGYGQVGFHVAPKALAWDLSRLNPIKGMKRMFSARAAVRAGMALLKIALIGATMGWVVVDRIPPLATLVGSDLGPALAAVGAVALRGTVGALVAILALALLDLGFQRWQHTKDLRMSKQEVKEEFKQTEGDPHVRARVRQVQREMASRRMMAAVPRATVVVTNPTHYAVALAYESKGKEGARAPRCVAKGVDHLARRIKDVAREAGVVCFEDVALARALHAQVEIGGEIPEDLYEAVASVLAYVYRVKGERVLA